MARDFRKFTKRVFIICNFVIVTFFLLACANAFLHPNEWWFFALLGLAFPFLLAAVTAFFFFWLIFKSKWALVSLAALLLGYYNIRALIGFHFSGNFEHAKKEGTVRILTWNVSWFDEQKKEKKGDRAKRNEMLAFIKQQDADLLCFQEYLEFNARKNFYSNVKDLAQLGYPYHFFVNDYTPKDKSFSAGVAVFSRFPIVDSIRIRYIASDSLHSSESLIATDINIEGKLIRVFNTHLQSVLLQKKDYRSLQIIRNAEDSMVEASRSIVKKLKIAYAFRADQVDIVRKELDNSPYPEIICGDFSDVPNSYTYFRIKGNRNDAFVERSGGLGRTFSNVSSTLRIDYIMTDKQLKVLQYKRFLIPYSDHYPIVADIQLNDTAR